MIATDAGHKALMPGVTCDEIVDLRYSACGHNEYMLTILLLVRSRSMYGIVIHVQIAGRRTGRRYLAAAHMA
eukprot:COSAG02_NODE_7750_length_2862_cov_8.620736_2_plen_72_part_00